MEEVPLTVVHIQDKFWLPKLKIYRENTIPGAWPHLAVPIASLNGAAAHEKKPVQGDNPYTEGNVHKILEAAACALTQEPNAELERRMDELIAVVAAAQQPDGYVDAYVITRGKSWDGKCYQEDGYVTGHLLEAAVAHYRATSKNSYLDIACKAADSAWRYFVERKNPGFAGHAEFELALPELYRATGNRKYLDLARALIEARGEQKDIKGHAVDAVFFATGVADVGMETGDRGLCDSARRLWTSATKRKMYVTGGVGSRPEAEAFGDDYELPNREAYCESCANCGMINFAHRMLRFDGDAEAADVLELALYNAVLHGMALDGKSVYAYTTPLSDANHPRFVDWLCCASNLTRTLSQVGRYAYGCADNDVYVNLFIGGVGHVALKATPVTLRVETDYPWNGSVKINVDPERQAEFSLRVRIPGWSHDAAIRLNGEKIEPLQVAKGYAVIRRVWQRGDVVLLDMPMPVMRIEAHPNVLADRGKVAIQRGPIVYGLEALDNDGRALVSLPSNPQFQVEHRPDLLGGVTVVRGKTSDNRPFLAIPFYALANRENSLQEVWLYQEGKSLYGRPKDGWDGKLYREFNPQQTNTK